MFHARTRTDRRLDFWTVGHGAHEKAIFLRYTVYNNINYILKFYLIA